MPSRQLIACIDGTWNSQPEKLQFFSSPTNVARISQLLLNDGREQQVLYLPGVGTHGYSDRIVGGLWGAGSTARVRAVYRSLCQNFEPGDRISLFGFSRGAFAARVVAGLIATVGIAGPDQLRRVDEAISSYLALHRRQERLTFTTAGRANPASICFLGLWDTVVRHGPALAPAAWLIEWALNRRFGLRDHRSGRIVQRAAHALALDEDRSAFRPWRIATSSPDQTVDELWFAGSHSDVGGGCSESQPSELSLQWMVQCAAKAGLRFHDRPQIHEDACSARLNPSRVGPWRLQPSRRRVVLETDRLHDSVYLRMGATGYRPIAKLPSNLLASRG